MRQRLFLTLLAAATLAAASPALAQGYGSAGGVAATLGATASPPIARGAGTGGFAADRAIFAPPDAAFATGSVRPSERARPRIPRR